MRFVYKHFRFGWIADNLTVDPCLELHRGRHGVAGHYQRSVSKWTPREKGGYTICYVYSGVVEKQLLAIGTAECSPKDNFCYRTGREIARGKALLELGAAKVVARTRGSVVSWLVV